MKTGGYLKFIKTRRGGERFWVRVNETRPDGSVFGRVDNETVGPLAPRYLEPIEVPEEEILETVMHPRRRLFRVIERGAK